VTMTDTEAFEAMLAHHRSLTDGVAGRVATLRAALASGTRYQASAAELVRYLADEVLPHAQAEEQTIYPAAGQKPDLAGTVKQMTDEHRRLADLSEQLARAAGGQEALVAANAIGPLFAAHVDKENVVLLPRLRDDQGTGLAALLGQMRDLLDRAARHEEAVGDAAT
jgi:iron-sulfur cluster repair protein YtfE (RIC family)